MPALMPRSASWRWSTRWRTDFGRAWMRTYDDFVANLGAAHWLHGGGGSRTGICSVHAGSTTRSQETKLATIEACHPKQGIAQGCIAKFGEKRTHGRIAVGLRGT